LYTGTSTPNPSLKQNSKRGYRFQADQHHATSATSSFLLIHPVTESAVGKFLAKKEEVEIREAKK
jgi:hypothetical protein